MKEWEQEQEQEQEMCGDVVVSVCLHDIVGWANFVSKCEQSK